MPQIKIRIKDSKSVIETSGYQGESCKLATAPFLKVLGNVESSVDKDEIYEQPVTLDLTQNESL